MWRRIAATFASVNVLRNQVKSSFSGSRALLGQRLRRAIPIIIICILLTIVLERGGWLRSFESAALDTFVLLREPLTAKNIVIIGITKEDYEEHFDEKSPLDARKLQAIIEDIAKGHPAVIGVAVDTSDESFREFRLPQGLPPVVWLQDGEPEVSTNGSWKSLLPFISGTDTPFRLTDLPGREGKDVLSGLRHLPLDSDNAIRRYRRQFKTIDPAIPNKDSFSWAVVKEYGKLTGSAPEANESSQGWVMNFAVDEQSFKATSISILGRVADEAGWQGDEGFVKDKIVLLGGFYPTSGDEHQTPTGSKYGVELWAYAIESDLQAKAVKPPSRYLVWIGEVLVGLTLVFVHTRTGNRLKSWRYSLVAVPLLALLGSFFVFSSLTLWTLFLPTLMVVLIQQLYEDLQDYRKQKTQEMYDEAGNLAKDVKEIAQRFRQSTAAAFNPVDESKPTTEAEASEVGSGNQPEKPKVLRPEGKRSKRNRKREDRKI